MPALFRRHDAAAQAAYQELKQLARSQRRILSGTPGTLKQRTQSGKKYWVREHLRIDGRKVDEYLGPESSMKKDALERLREDLSLAKALAGASARLRLLGFQRIDRKPAAVLEVFFNRGLHQAGLAIVGSHAFGALLNELGIQAPAYRTQDLDIARAQPLAVALPEGFDFRMLLRESGLPFVAVPGMPSDKPSTSFKLPGAETLAVDLLVPGTEAGGISPVSELGAHAQTIPLLEFLIEDPIECIVLSPNQVIPVNLPAPERFVLHKLFSSQSRKADRGKIAKDLEQAGILAAALEELTPGVVLEAWRKVPRDRRSRIKRGALAAARAIEGRHAAAEKLLARIAR